mmetsp:Transcript_19767/g.66858  ORF Transcript_19767/g.66858 Transcript_19767/m.66858 type:complete len:230 (-) Transcript_19767:920-1609(-)
MLVMRTICSRNSRVSAKKALICKFVSTWSNCSTSLSAPIRVWILRPSTVAWPSASERPETSCARAANHFIRFSSRRTRDKAFSPVKYSLSSVMRCTTCVLQKSHFCALASRRVATICLSLYSSCAVFKSSVMSDSASAAAPAAARVCLATAASAEVRCKRRHLKATLHRRATSSKGLESSNKSCSVKWPSVRYVSRSDRHRVTKAALAAQCDAIAAGVSTFCSAALAAP